MTRTLITGATGNVGSEVVRFLSSQHPNIQPVIAHRNPEKAKSQLGAYLGLEYRHFDFEHPETFGAALDNIQRIFLVRPPQLADVDTYFQPLFEEMDRQNVREIVFLSVQGAGANKFIPHTKIENRIRDFSFQYIFLRPGYFMQNLTDEFLQDIQTRRRIELPAGKAKFNWIDAADIGKVGALCLARFDDQKNCIYELTGDEHLSFKEVVDRINPYLKHPIRYKNVSPPSFFISKKRQKESIARIFVMIALHFLPRFTKPARLTRTYENITGNKPNSIEDFVEREIESFESA